MFNNLNINEACFDISCLFQRQSDVLLVSQIFVRFVWHQMSLIQYRTLSDTLMSQDAGLIIDLASYILAKIHYNTLNISQ